MDKWKIGLGLYCVLVLYVSSMSPGEIPDTGVAVSDKAIHLAEYAIMGILAWGAFGKGGRGFPWGLLAFCACFGIADECWQDWLIQVDRRMCGMRQPMQSVPLSA